MIPQVRKATIISDFSSLPCPPASSATTAPRDDYGKRDRSLPFGSSSLSSAPVSPNSPIPESDSRPVNFGLDAKSDGRSAQGMWYHTDDKLIKPRSFTPSSSPFAPTNYDSEQFPMEKHSTYEREERTCQGDEGHSEIGNKHSQSESHSDSQDM
ncbi:hypothetical protein TREMEDRAFT_56534, partial [Tremella mesenterica DSM 1558]